MTPLVISIVTILLIIVGVNVATHHKESDEGEHEGFSRRKMKYVMALICVLLGMMFFNFIVSVPLLFVLFLYAFLMMFYYGFFWITLNSESFRRREKVDKVTIYALCLYWGILFFEIFHRSIKFLNTRYDRAFGWGEEFDALLSNITGEILESLVMSTLFVGAVYFYKRYVR